MYNKIAQLILTPGKKSNTTSEIFVAQPDSNKEELVGKLFVIVEIESKKISDLKLINYLIESINSNYYQNEKIILRERVKTVKVEHIFESALTKTNKNLADFIKSEKIKLNPKLINATVGIIYKDTLHFASIGKNKAFLVHKKASKTTSVDQDKYSMTDIIKHSETDGKKTQLNNKLFSNVISGSIPVNGYFIFTNEALPEYFSSKQLLEIVTSLPPASAVEQIKNSLSKINHYVSFLSLIIKNTLGAEKEEVKKIVAKPTTEESVTNLNKVEEDTEKLLTPGGYINAKKWIKFPSKIFNKLGGSTVNKNVKKEVGANTLRDKIFFKKKTSLFELKKVWLPIKYLFTYILNFIVYLFKLLTNKEKFLEFIGNIKSLPKTIRYKTKNTVSWFKNLSTKNKVLFILAIISLLLFIQNLFTLNIKNIKLEEEKSYTELVKPIEQKQNQVEASLLYGNEDGARTLLTEIKELLDMLPRETEEQKTQYNSFNKKYFEQLEKIRHVTKIINPKELAVFSNLNTNANPTNIALSAETNKIYSGDTSQKTIYSLDLSDNLITAITGLDATINLLKFPVVSKGDYIYYFNNDSIVELNIKTEEIKTLPITLPGNASDLSSMAIYSNRIYLIDEANSEIYRYNKRPSGFADRLSWLNENVDLGNSVSASIDGHVYILKSNGEVLKFLKGVQKELELDTPEPAIEKATKLFVSPDLKYIYVLEPSKQRLVLFDKTGDFLTQYQSDQFNDLRDFQVDENKKLIYFLNKNSVYEVNAVHFEE